MPRLSQSDLAERNKAFESNDPQDLLQWAADTFSGRVAAISALQAAGSVVCHMIGQLDLDIPVLFVDTGVNFPETLATRDAIGEAYGLDIRTLSPPQTMDEQIAERRRYLPGSLFRSQDYWGKTFFFQRSYSSTSALIFSGFSLA